MTYAARSGVLPLALFVWAILLTGPTILLHEAGHALAAHVHGQAVTLGAFAISYPGDIMLTAQERALVAAAGPLVSLMLAFAGVLLVSTTLAHRPNWQAPALAIIVASLARFAVTLAFLPISILRWAFGTEASEPNFDEYNFASRLDLPVFPILVGLLIACLLFGRFVDCRLPEGRKRKSWAALVAGTIFGIAIWAMIGSFLF